MGSKAGNQGSGCAESPPPKCSARSVSTSARSRPEPEDSRISVRTAGEVARPRARGTRGPVVQAILRYDSMRRAGADQDFSAPGSGAERKACSVKPGVGMSADVWSFYICQARRAKDHSPRREPCGIAGERYRAPERGERPVSAPEVALIVGHSM